MAKAATQKAPDTEEPKMSFLQLAEQSSAFIPNKPQGKTGDPLATAKGKVLQALDTQKKVLSLSERGEALPRSKSGDRSVSTWFSKTAEGYWTSLRYGQTPIKLDGKVAWRFGTADKLQEFYDAAKEAIRNGELDDIIGDLQKSRSAVLTGRTGKKKAA